MKEATKHQSVREILDGIIRCGIEEGVSDIHIDPFSSCLSIKLRKNGFIRQVCTFSLDIHQQLISCLKILASLRTDIHQAAQDGRFEFSFQEIFYDIRLSVIPTFFGENAVMRILKRELVVSSFKELGFSDSSSILIKKIISRSSGLVIVSGPTGGGKTTTLHSMLKSLVSDGRNIITLEDPIEFILEGARQIQINHEVGIQFQDMLKAILRQDPDIVMVGEIRDAPTAQSVARMALTGHLVFTTVHSSDTLSVIHRLLDMGIERSLLASTLSLIIFQKLVKRICIHCRKECEPLGHQLEYIHTIRGPTGETPRIFQGNGCETCEGKGFSGRLCLNEVLEINSTVRDALLDSRKISHAQNTAQSQSQLFDLLNNGEISLETAMEHIHL